MEGVEGMIIDRQLRTKMACYLGLFQYHKIQKNRRIEKFTKNCKEKKEFELKMLAFLALLDNKIAMRNLKQSSVAVSVKE